MKTCQTCLFWQPNQEPVEQSEDAKYLCRNPDVAIRTWIDFGCSLHMSADSTEANVPNHTRYGTMTDPNPNPVDGPTEILIATFGTPIKRCSGAVVSDLDWLRYCLRAIRKFCTGFQGVTIVHPLHEAYLFESLRGEFDVRLAAFPEEPGKGFLAHMIAMASAELIVPPSTKYVLHCDADCIFKMPTTPEHFFWQDKPYYIVRSWESLTTEDPRNPGSKVVSDCLQWRQPTEAQLGFSTPVFSMCMNKAAFPIDFYRPYREHIAKVHRKPFEKYMFSGKNDHPATRMDWTCMGSFAYHAMRDRFTWFNVECPPYPSDRTRTYWSHSGVTPEIKSEIENILA